MSHGTWSLSGEAGGGGAGLSTKDLHARAIESMLARDVLPIFQQRRPVSRMNTPEGCADLITLVLLARIPL